MTNQKCSQDEEKRAAWNVKFCQYQLNRKKAWLTPPSVEKGQAKPRRLMIARSKRQC